MLRSTQHKAEKVDNHVSPTSVIIPSKSFSDNSSDSGYDESSNLGMNADKQNSGFNSKQVSIEQLNRPITISN